MLKQIAHAEDLHVETTSNLVHNLSQWLIALPLFIGLCIISYFLLTNTIKQPKSRIIIVFMGLFFITGVATFSFVPILSVITLTLGIGLSLFFTLISLAK